MPDLSYSYAHAWESMYKGIDEQGPYYSVSYYFSDWANSDAVANELRGYTQRAGTYTLRIPPHTHPLSQNLSCTDVRIEGCGAPVLNSSGLPYYSGGFLAHCTYRSITYVPTGSQDPGNQNQIDPATPILWCSQEFDYRTERLPYADGKYKWSDNTPTSVPIDERYGVSTLVLTYHQLPYMPSSVIRSLRGKLNNATFLGASTGCVLFEGGKTFREFNTDGTISNRCTLIFQERDQDWRKFLKDDGTLTTWDFIKRGNGDYLFELADFTPLINL
jgi:hypothetical protein